MPNVGRLNRTPALRRPGETAPDQRSVTSTTMDWGTWPRRTRVLEWVTAALAGFARCLGLEARGGGLRRALTVRGIAVESPPLRFLRPLSDRGLSSGGVG
jgi:hypothetical protein